MAKIADMNEKIAQSVTEGYKKIEDKFTGAFLTEDGSLKTGKVGEAIAEGFQKIEDGVVGGYKKIEEGVVGGFGKVSDKFIDVLFTKEGETVEEAKKRLERATQAKDEGKGE